MSPLVEPFFDPVSGTFSYVVYSTEGSECVIIDPVLDFDASSGRIGTQHADHIIAFVRAHHLQVDYLLETHVHADHLTASDYLKQILGGDKVISHAICDISTHLQVLFNLPSADHNDGSAFDQRWKPGHAFNFGVLSGTCLAVPGHTPADFAYLIGDAVFIGDTLFMPDVGSARCDFPGGSASQLYASVQHLFALPSHTRMFICHDYPPAGRTPSCQTSIAAQQAQNIHVNQQVTPDAFISMRTQRDATLSMPKLIRPSLYINLRAGLLPEPDVNGVRYLTLLSTIHPA